jgi:hypothetical protein
MDETEKSAGAEVVLFVPRPSARVVPLRSPRAVDLEGRRGMGVRRDPATYPLPSDGGPEAA